MGGFVWQEQVATLSAALGTVEARVAQGDLDTPGLDAFKSALDDLRLRAWGALMAVTADDPHGFQERFRIRRGTEMCRAVTTDLRTGKLSASQPELPALGATAKDLATAVKEVGRPAPRRRGRGNGKTGR